MNDKKNIDRLFQEKFKDFEVAPSDAVWNRINQSLPNKKKKRRVIALWWQIGGVAAVIALLLTVGISVFDSSDNTIDNPVIVGTENKEDIQDNKDDNTSPADNQDKLNKNQEIEKLEFVNSDENDELIENKTENNTPQNKSVTNPLTNSTYKSQTNAVVKNTSTKEQQKTSPSQKLKSLTETKDKDNTKVAANTNNSENNKDVELLDKSKIKSAIKKTIENNNTAVTENTKSEDAEKVNSESINSNAVDSFEKEKEAALTEDQKKESIENAIAAQENTDEEEKEDKPNRWSIAPNVAPVYYSSLGQGSSLDEQFSENSKSSDINMSYGITAGYAISKKLKIRAGVNRVNLNQSTSGILAVTSPTPMLSTSFTATEKAPQKYANLTLNRNARSMSIMSAKAMVASSDLSSTYKLGNIDQRFSFIEVPIELEYRLLDKKFGLNVIGGFSTFFLNQNEVYADIDGTSTLIGEANNINSTSYSANFGLGLDYSLSKQWNINLEPQFKYQINTFNNTSGDFQPFFIGVYTGLSFKF